MVSTILKKVKLARPKTRGVIVTTPVEPSVKSIDNTGLILIGLFSLLYDQFSRNFAELHIQLPFLNFPIFAGEILLGLCIGLAISKYRIDSHRLSRPQWKFWFAWFIAFVLIKALCGYIKWGPLALRDSALFYYSLFFLLGSYFYRRDFFKGHVLTFLIILFLFRLGFQKSFLYSALMLTSITFILIKSYPHKILKRILLVLFVLCIPYQLLFVSARMMMIGNAIAFFYLIAAFIFLLPVNLKAKISVCVFLIAATIAAFHKIPDKVRLGSTFDLHAIWQLYQVRNESALKRKAGFELMSLPDIALYNPGSHPLPVQTPMLEAKHAKTIEGEQYWYGAENVPTPNSKRAEVEQVIGSKYGNMVGNAVFRLLIWRDVLDILIAEKPILGIDFGKPFRSFRLEVLYLGSGEWGRDGWIAPHNSYLNMIYRAGLIGAMMVAAIFYLWLKMAYSFIRLRSVSGILLCASLLSWLVAANFGLIFELPYTAIPIWSFYGMVFAYWREKVSLQSESMK